MITCTTDTLTPADVYGEGDASFGALPRQGGETLNQAAVSGYGDPGRGINAPIYVVLVNSHL